MDLSASSVLMNVLENDSNPRIMEERLSLHNAEVLSLGDSSPRSTMSSSLMDIEEEFSEENNTDHQLHRNEQQTNTTADSFLFHPNEDEGVEEQQHQELDNDDEEFSQFILMEHSYEDKPEDEKPVETPSTNNNLQMKDVALEAIMTTSTNNIIQPKETSSFRRSSSSRNSTSLLRGTTTTTPFASRNSVQSNTSSSLNGSFGFGSSTGRGLDQLNKSTKNFSAGSNSRRDLELENELLGKHRPTTNTPKHNVRSTSPISKIVVEEVVYTPPSNTSSITLKDKKDIEKAVERLKVKQRYLEDRVKRETTPPKGRVVSKPSSSRVYTSSERVVSKPLYEKEPTLTLAQLQFSIEHEKRRKRIEDKQRELQESKNLRARAIREEKLKRENHLKEDSILFSRSFNYESINKQQRPSTPSMSKRPSTSAGPNGKRPNSSYMERPKSSISIETVKPGSQQNQQRITQTSIVSGQPAQANSKTPSKSSSKDLFNKQQHSGFLSDSHYKSPKDVKDFNALLKEQEKLLNNIRELKNKIQQPPSSSSKKY